MRPLTPALADVSKEAIRVPLRCVIVVAKATRPQQHNAIHPFVHSRDAFGYSDENIDSSLRPNLCSLGFYCVSIKVASIA